MSRPTTSALAIPSGFLLASVAALALPAEELERRVRLREPPSGP